MKTLYAACLCRLGLSQAEAAALHSVRLDTVKSWSSGRNRVPDGAWEDLRDLEAKIVNQSEAVRELWEDNGEPLQISPNARDKQSLMALADFVLTTPVKLV
ncbi:MAG: helix-turn-helix domain-containing protein [Novosphingobium sp.]